MNENDLLELKEIEDRLYNILNRNNMVDTILGDSWCKIYEYLKTNRGVSK